LRLREKITVYSIQQSWLLDMLRIFLQLVLLAAVWVCVVWLAFPVNLTALDTPSLVSLHIAPPLLAVFVWWTGKRVWKWNTTRREEIRTREATVKEEEERTAKAAAHEAGLAQRRAFVECRAAWLAVPAIPEWSMDDSAQCLFIEQDVDALRRGGREAALASSLRQVFETALTQCEALAYLPLYLLPGDGLEIARKAWQEVLPEFLDAEKVPAPDFRRLPDADEPLPDRLIALFENKPTMPAMWLIGMDSLLDERPETVDDKAGIKPGHAVGKAACRLPG
jgi:hypothetical protein